MTDTRLAALEAALKNAQPLLESIDLETSDLKELVGLFITAAELPIWRQALQNKEH